MLSEEAIRRYTTELLQGLPSALPILGVPGNIAIMGENTFPVIVGPKPRHDVVVAAAIVGKGRVIAISHNGYLDETHQHKVGPFLQHWIRWVGGVQGSSSSSTTRNKIQKNHVMLWDGDESVNSEQLWQFVHDEGGGVIVASCPWGWAQVRGKAVKDHTCHKFLTKCGMYYGDLYVSDDETQVFQVRSANDEILKNSIGCPQRIASSRHPAVPTKTTTSSKLLRQSFNHVVNCSEGDKNNVKPCYGEGGWWAPCGDCHWIDFRFPKPQRIVGVDLWCVNVDACPQKIVLSSSETAVSVTWDFIRESDGEGGNKRQQYKIEGSSGFQSSLVSSVRLTLQGIHNSYYVGINNVQFLVEDTTPNSNNTTGIDAFTCALKFAPNALIEAALLQSASQLNVFNVENLLDPTEFSPPTPDQPFVVKPHLCNLFSWMCASETHNLPGMDVFPGRCTGASPLSEPVVLNLCTQWKDAWVSTHLYVNPGDTLRFRVVEGDGSQWQLRIGCHTDDLTNCEGLKWSRWPIVTKTIELLNDRTAKSTTSKFGGLVFLESKFESPMPITIEFMNVHRAPHWSQADGFVDGDAPWGESTGSMISFFLPAHIIRDAAQKRVLEDCMKYWDSVLLQHHALSKAPYKSRPERVCVDVQLSVGYMHSGYPIMAHVDFADTVFDLAKLRKEGSWGMFHELGHNMQQSWWTWDEGMTEVSVNWFTLHAMENICHRKWKDHWFYAEIEQKTTEYLASKRPDKYEQVWKKEPFLALSMFHRLIESFGWQWLKAVLQGYEDAPPEEGDDLVSVWAVRTSAASGKNLIPYYRSWGLPQKSLTLAEPQVLRFPVYSH